MNYIFRLQKILLFRTNQQDYVCRKEMSKYSKRLICVCKREKKPPNFLNAILNLLLLGQKDNNLPYLMHSLSLKVVALICAQFNCGQFQYYW
jgi:hypothetical protein